ncbi:MAG TPA: DMT family transporter [Acidimicrobiales bacterium]|nr:DMT family transporter [Acidimicrobiales bacterium]
MGIVLGLVAAILYGSGDFAGGRAAEGVDVRRVLLVSQATAAVGSLVALAFVHGVAVGADLGRGVAAGLLTAVGLGLLYRALAIGRASVVAPLCAATGAVVPVTWGLATGERPGAVALVGVVCAIAAGVLLARGDEGSGASADGVPIAIAAGVALGASFVCFAATTDASGLWPVAASRLAGVLVVALAISARRPERIALPADVMRIAVIAGVCDVVATVALVAGLRAELAVLVAALAALAPGFTVACAWLFARERVGREQLVGVGLALVGLALIAAR